MHQSRVSIRNGKFATVMQWGGSGDPLVFLHGAAGPMVGAPFLDELAKHFTVYAPAHPGFPPGTGIEHLDDVIDLALYYHDFLDEMGIVRPHLVGHSLGGMLAAEIAALAPDRVDKLVLVGPAGFWLDAHPIPDFFAMKPKQLFELALHDGTGPLAQQLTQIYEGPEAGLALHQCMAAAAKFLWPIPDKGLKKRIHRIQQPTLLVWGEADRIVPPVYATLFQQEIRGAQLTVMPEVGHIPMIEAPESFVALVRDFLSM